MRCVVRLAMKLMRSEWGVPFIAKEYALKASKAFRMRSLSCSKSSFTVSKLWEEKGGVSDLSVSSMMFAASSEYVPTALLPDVHGRQVRQRVRRSNFQAEGKFAFRVTKKGAARFGSLPFSLRDTL